MNLRTKKILSVIMSVVFVIGLLPISAIDSFADDTVYTSSDGLYKYMVLADGTASICSGTNAPAYLGSDLDYVSIPRDVDGYKVSTVGQRAFSGLAVKCVFIPTTVTLIDNYAFLNCSSLSDIHFSEGLKKINYGAFMNCTMLTVIKLPKTLTTMGTNAFKGCTGMVYFNIPDSMTAIGNSVFAGCTQLSYLHIPASVTSINQTAITDCTNLSRIYGVAGSYAQTFASDNSFTFVNCPTFNVQCTVTGESTIAIDTSTPNDERFYFKFVPADSGWYSVSSQHTSGDPKCNIAEDMFFTHSNVYDDNNDRDFIAEEFFVAGREYYIQCFSCNNDPFIGSVSIEKLPGVDKVEIITDSVTGFAGQLADINYSLYPDNAYFGEINFTSSDSSIVGVTCYGTLVLRNPGTATVTVSTDSGATGTVSVTVLTIPEIFVDDTPSAHFSGTGEYFYYKFVPQTTGYYIFYSDADVDTYGYLYNSSFDEIDSNDDSIGSNFLIKANLTAGETYYFGARTYYSSAVGDADFYLKTAPIADSFDIDLTEITLFEGVQDEAYYDVNGTDFSVLGDCTLTSSDESVVQIDFYDDNYIYLNPVGAGTATVTMENELGFSDSIDVTVIGATALTLGTACNSSLAIETEGEFEKTFKFTASADGDYIVKLTNISTDNELDMCGLQNFENYTNITTSNILYLYGCDQGQTYYIDIYNYNPYVDEDTDFTITVAPSVSATSIEFTCGSTLNVTLGTVTDMELDCIFQPWNAGIEAYYLSSSDESVIYAQSNQISAIGTGTAVVTATSTSGLTATLTVTVSAPETITLGQGKSVSVTVGGARASYAFTPSVTGDYIFYSVEDGAYTDTVGHIYGSNGVVLYNNDDNPDVSTNQFAIIASLEAGETYYLVSRLYDSDDTGDYIVFIEVLNNGDLNFDGEWDLADYGMLKDELIEEYTLDGTRFLIADINYDTAVDAFDLFLLDKKINGLA